MATQKLIPAPTCADTAGTAPLNPTAACGARTARGAGTPTGDFMTCSGGHSPTEPHGAPFGASGWFTWTDDDTAPLPPKAAEALAKLERAFAPERTAQEYRKAAVRVRELSDLAVFEPMSDLDARSMAEAEADMAAAHTVLAEAGRLDLIGGA